MDPLDELAVVAPAEFVTARNRIVDQLKADGDPQTAAQVAKLRRPSQVHWAINTTVRERPDLAGAWARAAEAARQASGAELRTALATVRTAASALAKAAGRHGSTGNVAAVLAGAAADPELTMAVAGGTLGLTADLARPRPTPKHAAAPAEPTPPLRGRAQAAVTAAREALAQAEVAERRATADLAATTEALDAARQAAASAEREHVAAKRRQVAAERLVLEATDQLAHAERRLAAIDRG